MTELEKNFQWYLDNQDAVVKYHDQKYVVIFRERVCWSFCTMEEAYNETIRQQVLGEAIIQKVSAGDKDYTVNIFNSNTTHAYSIEDSAATTPYQSDQRIPLK